MVVIGGGYTGMWAAWHLLAAGARVTLLEAEICGHGPSGRNGGFCESMWMSAPVLRGAFGDGPTRALLVAPRLEAIFDHRRRVLEGTFGVYRDPTSPA